MLHAKFPITQPSFALLAFTICPHVLKKGTVRRSRRPIPGGQSAGRNQPRFISAFFLVSSSFTVLVMGCVEPLER